MLSKYIVFPQPDQIEVRTEEVGDPGPDEVACKARKSLISTGTETYCLRGNFDEGSNWASWVQYPFRPGYSMASEVIAVGKDVTDVAVGDRVTSWTPHEETFITKPSSLFPTPDGVSDEDASWMCLATTTQVAVRRAQHALGEAVGVVGLGLLGQLIVQYLSLSGARMIVAIDTVDKRFEMASAHGATHTVQSDVASSQDDVLAMTGGRGLDVVYDATGHAPVLASCIGLVRRLGRIVLVGDTPNPTAQHLAPGFVSNSIAILGIHGTMTPEQSSEFNPWTRAEVTALFFDYLLQGRMRVSDLITHHHGPDDAPGVYAALTQDRFFSMGVILDWA